MAAISVVAAFDRAAAYDAHAVVQAQVARRLADRIAALPLPPSPRVLEIGCGTGFLGVALRKRLAGARWTMTDIAPAMVARARARFAGDDVAFAVLDGAALEPGGRFDLICSSLAAQWFTDLPGALARWRGALTDGGRIAFSTLAAGSLAEWRAAGGAGAHDYPDAAALGRCGLAVAIEPIVDRAADGPAFLRALKAIGAGTPRPGHRPLGPAALRAALARFEAAGACATYQVAYCVGGA